MFVWFNGFLCIVAQSPVFGSQNGAYTQNFSIQMRKKVNNKHAGKKYSFDQHNALIKSPEAHGLLVSNKKSGNKKTF